MFGGGRAILTATTCAVALAGCAPMPAAREIQGGRDLLAATGPLPAVHAPSTAPGRAAGTGTRAVAGSESNLRDGRARFRQLFCERLAASVTASRGRSCDEWLWRLRDEAAAPAVVARPPSASDVAMVLPPPRLVIVTGAFADCFGQDALPFSDAIVSLRTRGYQIDTLRVSGRSSAAHNARQIVDGLHALPSSKGERLALLGYSKGAIDILQALNDAPDIAQRVVAVISLAGPIGGTPLARSGRWWYDHLAARGWTKRCDPGDGGVVDSLLPAVRRAALEAQPLPPSVRYYSLAALPEPARLAAVLRGSSRLLGSADRWNDGQVTVTDALVPGSTILGLVNADHWGVALRIESALPRLAARRDARPFPHEALLEATLLFVGEDARPATPMAGGAARE